jgi:hypothetical protein
LPSDWNVETTAKVEVPYIGWMDLPCPKSEKCERQNVCNQTVFDKCREYLNDEKMTTNFCRCDINKGVFAVPTINIPIKLEKVKPLMTVINSYGKGVIHF